MRLEGLTRVCGVFAATFALLAALWLLLAPAYNAVIFSAADGLLRLDDPVSVALSNADGAWTADQVDGARRVPVFEFDRFGTFFNVVLLLSLLAAAPEVRRWRRLGLAGLASVLLAGFHVVFVVLHVKAQFVNLGLLAASARDAYLMNWAAVLLGVLGEQLVPLLLVGALTWRAWLGLFVKRRPLPAHHRRVPRGRPARGGRSPT